MTSLKLRTKIWCLKCKAIIHHHVMNLKLSFLIFKKTIKEKIDYLRLKNKMRNENIKLSSNKKLFLLKNKIKSFFLLLYVKIYTKIHNRRISFRSILIKELSNKTNVIDNWEKRVILNENFTLKKKEELIDFVYRVQQKMENY